MPNGLFGPGEGRLEASGSNFLAIAFPIEGPQAFRNRLSERRGLHPGARHHVWAWRMDGALGQASDDGEPQGTGGHPILDLLAARDLESAAVIVSRYFGGTLLGRPRLLRAYRASASLALDAAPRGTFRDVVEAGVDLPWSAFSRVEGWLGSPPVLAWEAAYGPSVRLDLALAEEGAEAFLERLADASGGGRPLRLERGRRLIRPGV